MMLAGPPAAGGPPLRVALYWMVTGRTIGGLRITPDRNTLDRETALRMWTENVTWFSNEEGKKGRIQVGQLADLLAHRHDLVHRQSTAVTGAGAAGAAHHRRPQCPAGGDRSGGAGDEDDQRDGGERPV